MAKQEESQHRQSRRNGFFVVVDAHIQLNLATMDFETPLKMAVAKSGIPDFQQLVTNAGTRSLRDLKHIQVLIAKVYGAFSLGIYG